MIDELSRLAAQLIGLKRRGASGGTSGACRKEDPDPEGKQLAATSDPLGEATKLLDKLKQHAASRCGALEQCSAQRASPLHAC